MSRLGEIEEILLYSGESKQELIADETQYGYVRLLIRAVRQLGARHIAMMEVMTSKYAKVSFARDHPIDSDVLTLIAYDKG